VLTFLTVRFYVRGPSGPFTPTLIAQDYRMVPGAGHRPPSTTTTVWVAGPAPRWWSQSRGGGRSRYGERPSFSCKITNYHHGCGGSVLWQFLAAITSQLALARFGYRC
jgi:hypothetical protein